jgi:hypothetical protein
VVGKEALRRGWSFALFDAPCNEGWLLMEWRFFGFGRVPGNGPGGDEAMMKGLRKTVSIGTEDFGGTRVKKTRMQKGTETARDLRRQLQTKYVVRAQIVTSVGTFCPRRKAAVRPRSRPLGVKVALIDK